eukprot:gnl/TRDRNA2_/TRDRNA2_181556_c0_seq1.p1 gnl/TRDRNA2_/TRDRNA2_181556_c0~~gnl/TRDRNA2_/TRDRNA2_181556_c0_seq1.p1  ORF type:complete len:502 (-),score=101.26 gnl/TRDRNA2_/TRDRNA2_181556_c0_seq1:22-1527(-)
MAEEPATSPAVSRTVSSWREHWRQLSVQAWCAESDIWRELQNSRLLTQVQLEELRVESRTAEDARKKWEHDSWTDLARARKRVSALARNVHFAPHKEDVRRMVHSAEHEIQVFAERSRQNFDELAAVECALEDTLESALVRFEGWCQEGPYRPPARSSSSTRPVRSSSCGHTRKEASKGQKENMSIREQVDLLDSEMLSAGGATGGWQTDDHETFLRLLRKFKRRTGPEFIDVVQQLLPHIKHEDLIAHVSWLEKHEEMQLRKRELLERWRGLRLASHANVQCKNDGGEQGAVATVKELEQRARARDADEKERAATRKKVAEWRQAKDQAKISEESERHRKEKAAQERQQRDRDRLKEATQRAVENFQRKRVADADRERKAVQRSASLGALRSPEDHERIAQRTAEHLARKAALMQAKSSSPQSSCLESPSLTQSAYRNVESRLHTHTESYVEKLRLAREDSVTQNADSSSKYTAMPMNFAHQGVVRTTRSCPGWRPHFGV